MSSDRSVDLSWYRVEIGAGHSTGGGRKVTLTDCARGHLRGEFWISSSAPELLIRVTNQGVTVEQAGPGVQNG